MPNSPAEADALIRSDLPRLPSEDCPLGQAHGRVLREPVKADRDLPPYHRVTMDGFALASSAVASGIRRFRTVGLQAAGMLPLTLVEPDQCAEIATGAVLPKGADAVVPYERCERRDGWVEISAPSEVVPAAHVHARGADAAAGQVLIDSGTRLSGREIAVAAACGAGVLRVSVLPRIALVVTGDELVEVEAASPSPHQIRRSNDYALRAALAARGYTLVERFHLRDMRDEILLTLRRLIAEFDVLLLSGGVSKGKYDFLPGVLEELKVEKRLRGLAQRPGKPFWFGVSPRRTPVFALPGNPVSTFVCFHRFVLPALAQMSGESTSPVAKIALMDTVPGLVEMAQMIPVKLAFAENGRPEAVTVPPMTSGDFVSLLGTDGFVELAPALEPIAQGTLVPYWPWW